MKNKIKIYTLIAILGIVLVVSGTSYAILTLLLEGTTTQSINAGTLSLNLEETNTITLTNAVPVKDEVGQANSPLVFSITNNGTIEAGYQLFIEDDVIDDTFIRIDNTKIKYELKVDGIKRSLTNLSLLETEIYKQNIKPGETVDFELRVWIDYEVTELNKNDMFAGKLRIDASQEILDLTTPASCFTFVSGTITGYDPTCPTDVVIPETINGETVTTIGEAAFGYINKYNNINPNYILLTSVVIPDSVTTISNFAFFAEPTSGYSGIGKIETIVIGNGVTSIGDYAFFGNPTKNLKLGNNVTTIGDYAFADNRLTEVTIPDDVTTIGDYVFIGNAEEMTGTITSLTLGNSVTTIGEAAFALNDLIEVTIPSSVTTIGYQAFFANPNLTRINLLGKTSLNQFTLLEDEWYGTATIYTEDGTILTP